MPPKKGRQPAPTPPPQQSLSMSSMSDLSIEPMLMLPPDGGYGWVVVAACFLMNLITDGAIFSFGFYQKSVQDEFDKDSAEVALLVSLCAGFYNVAAPLWSAVGNRWGFRTVGIVGASVAGSAYVVCFYIEEYGAFIFVYGVVMGAGSGAVYVATMISVGFYFERWRGVATSLTSCGSGVGVLVLPLCYQALAGCAGYTWRWILAFNASLYTLVLVLALLLRPLQPVAVSQARGERTVRFQDEEQSAAGVAATAAQSKTLKGKALRQLHSSQMSFAPSVAAPQFDAISMASRAYPRTGLDARDMQAGARPMYRDDIFYGASASRLGSQMSTRIAMTPIAAPSTSESLFARCYFCPHAVRSTLNALLHHSILSNTVFIVFAVTQAFVMIGFYTPYLFSQDQALNAGVPSHIAQWILPSIGLANAVGRGLSGILCEVPGVSALKLSCTSLTIAGIIVAITCASSSPGYQIFAASTFGLFVAPFVAMKSLILVDFLGIEKLTNSFGLLLMFQGIAIMVGPPMIGWVYDSTQSYVYVYVISGSLLFIASFTPYLMYPLSKYELKKEIKNALRRNS